MPVKMVATRACYVPSKHMEVKPDQKFEASDEREADRLTRQKRATRVVEESKPMVSQRRKVLSLNKDDAAPERSIGSYGRRDMRAED